MGNSETITVKLQIPAGKATPAPPIGPALGQVGVNIMEFCKKYNDMTKAMGDVIVPVELIVNTKDKSFQVILKTPPAAVLIKKALGIKSGSPTPNTKFVGTLSREQIESIANEKMTDLNAQTLDQAVKIIAGSARSMGVKVAS